MIGYGWCDNCRDRVGERRFRLLNSGFCEHCLREKIPGYGLQPTEKSEKPKTKRTVILSKEKLDEESILLEVLQNLKCPKTLWCRESMKILGWSKNQVRAVSSRLRKKEKFDFESFSTEELVLNSLVDKPKSCKQLAAEFGVCHNYLRAVLLRLEKSGKLKVSKPLPGENQSQRYIYSLNPGEL